MKSSPTKKKSDRFRSGFEAKIAVWLDTNKLLYEYEPCKLKYTVPETVHSYTPDWQIGGDRHIFYESKGYFSPADRKKLLYIKESNPNAIIRIIFMNSKVTISKRSKTTYAEWATKNGFDFFCWKGWKDGGGFKEWLLQRSSMKM